MVQGPRNRPPHRTAAKSPQSEKISAEPPSGALGSTSPEPIVSPATVGAPRFSPVQPLASLLGVRPGDGAPAEALRAADSYASSTRSMSPARVLDALLAHPDPKLGVLGAGLRDEGGRFRTYAIVRDGQVEARTATYDGKKLYLYVPATEPAAWAELERAAARDPERYGSIELRTIDRQQLGDFEERMQLKYDRPGVFWVSSRCPALPELEDDRYVVPGGRFGIELYYHDARINLPSARSTVETLARSGTPADRAAAEDALSVMRGTANALVNQVLHYGKIFNATLTVNAGRSQAPCLTTAALETYRAWLALDPADAPRAKRWLAWARDAAVAELQTVWMAPPRLDPASGLSRYADETPSVAPEEAPEFYAGIEWGPEDIASDAAIREHGWDSMPAALAGHGPDRGRPRVHHLLPVCLNSLLFKYEKDLAAIARELGEDGAPFDAAAERRKATMKRLMWSEPHGLFMDVLRPPGTKATRKNGHEDLRSFMPLWAGIVEPGSREAGRLAARIADFLRPGGLATATEASWRALEALNPEYTHRCQWGHKDVGWPIATYETTKGLRAAGYGPLADEIAYRWCAMVQDTMLAAGGAQPSPKGGFEAPIFEKMDVTRRSASGAAEIGYGNQGGEGAAGFRWGYDAYKLLYRELRAELQAHLAAGTDPEALFGAPLPVRVDPAAPRRGR